MYHLLLVALFFGHTPIPTADQEQTQICFQLQDGKVICPNASTDDGSEPVIEKKEYKQCEGEGETRVCGA